MGTVTSLRQTAERLIYRAAGLPVALAAYDDPLHAAFGDRYWHPRSYSEWTELAAGILLWPIILIAACAWFTARNGGAIRKRYGKPIRAQLFEQLQLYFSDGVLAPWYYIFSLHSDGALRAGTFLPRFETKTCLFRELKQSNKSPLNDKGQFAEFCNEHLLRCVQTIMCLDGRDRGRVLPDRDLFVKPLKGRGGNGAERWDRIAPDLFRGPRAETCYGRELLVQLIERSRRDPLIVQPRLSPHPDLLEITSGALPTVRVLTCLDPSGEPEVMTAMARTSFGSNRTVDNLHAGGIGALVDLETGLLSKASDLGSDAHLGWISVHPDSRAAIEGKRLPYWSEVKQFARDAHRAFSDRVVVGWDIAILEDGPILVEGNGNPDLDILQRFMSIGLREHRLAELLAHHLSSRGLIPSPAQGSVVAFARSEAVDEILE